ncbi:MAG: ABC transporter substrate-binding protein [Anaerolineales bacterium]|nr:ABC transporter substrate-binding protein [Anaerolineales bacterium]
MSIKKIFHDKLISIPDAVGMTQSHHVIGTSMAAAEPVGLLTELGQHRGRLYDVKIWVCLPLREYDFVIKPEMAGHFFVENWFYGAPDRAVHPQGRISYIPNNLHAAAKVRLEAAGNQLDVFWGTATPPDNRGYLSLSTSLVIEKMLIEAADLVILEINENLPWTLGDTHIHISEVDYLVENHVPLFELPSAPPSEWEREIGGHIAELIDDGATLQLGIGGIPNAITAFLLERRDLGIHTEMFTDGMVDLYEAGVVTGRKKTLWPGKMVGAFALGSQKLYDFLDNNLGVEFQQGKVTNDPYTIAKNYKMVSVNTALQVDINGQVCSQSIGPRHYSGTGGQLDTHRGAQMAEGGRGIIALHSTAKGGTISTIVPMLSPGAEVTIAGQDVDTIVTEFGIARLRGLNVKQRMEALIQIAHPDFRDWIREEAERLKIVPNLAVPGFSERTDLGTIKLGTLCDLSGQQADIGIDAYRGFSTYYEHINYWGGIHGKKIELIVEDHGFDPKRAINAGKKLVEEDQVFAIVSPLGTSPNLAVMDYFLENEVPVISPHSGISVWSNPVKPTYFALQPSYEVEGRLLAKYAVDFLGAKKAAVVSVDDHYGQEGARSFITSLKKEGIELVVQITHSDGDYNSEEWAAKLAHADPDLVMLFTYVKPAADLLESALKISFKPNWLGSYVISGTELLQLSGWEASEGVRTAAYPSGPRSHRGERLFKKLLERKYPGTLPSTHNRIGYAAAQVVVEGLRRAGPNPSRSRFIEALESLERWTGGVLPQISYSKTDHHGLMTLSLQRAANGRWVSEIGALDFSD